MPILDVEVITASGAEPTSGLAQKIADEVGGVLRTPPGHTWVRLRMLPGSNYAENGERLDPADLPVFVDVLQHAPATGPALDAEAADLTAAIARAIGRSSDRVHLKYAAPLAGRQAFGGRIVR